MSLMPERRRRLANFVEDLNGKVEGEPSSRYSLHGMGSFRRVYLDHSATTPADDRVIQRMLPYLTAVFGNASSVHSYGQEARAAVERARRQVAELICAQPTEIVFVSGGTEANNLAIRGLAQAAEKYGKHIITSNIEHPSVREVCSGLESKGFEIRRLRVDQGGIISLMDLREAIRPETVLISIMLGNNEIGTLQPVNEIGSIVQAKRERGHRLWFHTDAVQAAGRMSIDVQEIGCDLLTISAHKLYAPKGAGALFVRKGVRLASQTIGGHQERERRAGTESVPCIVAFGEAAKLAKEELVVRAAHDRNLRDKFEAAVEKDFEGVVFNGNGQTRLPHISNLSFPCVEGEALLVNLDIRGVAVSTGSACSSGSLEPSPVIRALGVDDDTARGAVRFSFGKDNSEEDVAYALEVLAIAIANLRHQLSPQPT